MSDFSWPPNTQFLDKNNYTLFRPYDWNKKKLSFNSDFSLPLQGKLFFNISLDNQSLRVIDVFLKIDSLEIKFNYSSLVCGKTKLELISEQSNEGLKLLNLKNDFISNSAFKSVYLVKEYMSVNEFSSYLNAYLEDRSIYFINLKNQKLHFISKTNISNYKCIISCDVSISKLEFPNCVLVFPKENVIKSGLSDEKSLSLDEVIKFFDKNIIEDMDNDFLKKKVSKFSFEIQFNESLLNIKQANFSFSFDEVEIFKNKLKIKNALFNLKFLFQNDITKDLELSIDPVNSFVNFECEIFGEIFYFDINWKQLKEFVFNFPNNILDSLNSKTSIIIHFLNKNPIVNEINKFRYGLREYFTLYLPKLSLKEVPEYDNVVNSLENLLFSEIILSIDNIDFFVQFKNNIIKLFQDIFALGNKLVIGFKNFKKSSLFINDCIEECESFFLNFKLETIYEITGKLDISLEEVFEYIDKENVDIEHRYYSELRIFLNINKLKDFCKILKELIRVEDMESKIYLEFLERFESIVDLKDQKLSIFKKNFTDFLKSKEKINFKDLITQYLNKEKIIHFLKKLFEENIYFKKGLAIYGNLNSLMYCLKTFWGKLKDKNIPLIEIFDVLNRSSKIIGYDLNECINSQMGILSNEIDCTIDINKIMTYSKKYIELFNRFKNTIDINDELIKPFLNLYIKSIKFNLTDLDSSITEINNILKQDFKFDIDIDFDCYYSQIEFIMREENAKNIAKNLEKYVIREKLENINFNELYDLITSELKQQFAYDPVFNAIEKLIVSFKNLIDLMKLEIDNAIEFINNIQKHPKIREIYQTFKKIKFINEMKSQDLLGLIQSLSLNFIDDVENDVKKYLAINTNKNEPFEFDLKKNKNQENIDLDTKKNHLKIDQDSISKNMPESLRAKGFYFVHNIFDIICKMDINIPIPERILKKFDRIKGSIKIKGFGFYLDLLYNNKENDDSYLIESWKFKISYCSLLIRRIDNKLTFFINGKLQSFNNKFINILYSNEQNYYLFDYNNNDKKNSLNELLKKCDINENISFFNKLLLENFSCIYHSSEQLFDIKLSINYKNVNLNGFLGYHKKDLTREYQLYFKIENFDNILEKKEINEDFDKYLDDCKCFDIKFKSLTFFFIIKYVEEDNKEKGRKKNQQENNQEIEKKKEDSNQNEESKYFEKYLQTNYDEIQKYKKEMLENFNKECNYLKFDLNEEYESYKCVILCKI